MTEDTLDQRNGRAAELAGTARRGDQRTRHHRLRLVRQTQDSGDNGQKAERRWEEDKDKKTDDSERSS